MVLSLINQQNPSLPQPLTAENIYFGVPHMAADGKTTVLPSVGELGTIYTGYQNFQYKRINLSTAYDSIPVIASTGASTLHGMLNVVNAVLGLNLTTEDVLDTNISYISAGAQVNVTVQAAPGSLGYTGAFFFLFNRLYEQFSKAIPNTELGVLNWPSNPAGGKTDLSMLMWNNDFSADVASIATNGNTWANQAAVKALMAADYGFTDWPAPGVNAVADYSTSKYPGANTNFQRVVVQTGVSGGTYQGTAMFHYNPS
jgi:hypothetical protein